MDIRVRTVILEGMKAEITISLHLVIGVLVKVLREDQVLAGTRAVHLTASLLLVIRDQVKVLAANHSIVKKAVVSTENQVSIVGLVKALREDLVLTAGQRSKITVALIGNLHLIGGRKNPDADMIGNPILRNRIIIMTGMRLQRPSAIVISQVWITPLGRRNAA